MKQIDLKDQYFGTEIEMTGISRYDAAVAIGSRTGEGLTSASSFTKRRRCVMTDSLCIR